MPVTGSAEETEQKRLAPTEMYSVLQEMGISSVCSEVTWVLAALKSFLMARAGIYLYTS